MKRSEVFSRSMRRNARPLCRLFVLVTYMLAVPVTAQIKVKTDTSLPVDANPDNPGGGAGTIVRVSKYTVLSGIPGIVRTSGTQPLLVEFKKGGRVVTPGTGILVSTGLDSFTAIGGKVEAVNEGIILTDAGISVSGDFNNDTKVRSSGSSAIVVNGSIGGTFSNAGVLEASITAGRGISIGNTVGDGFTNTGRIGKNSKRVGLEGIFVGGQVTGNFLNQGNIFSTQQGLLLNENGTTVTGNFTNTGEIDSSGNTAIDINGAVGGSFANSGSLLSPSGRGISIRTTVGNGFMNTGDMGINSAVGQQGIFIGGLVTGGFQNDGDIVSTQNAISLIQGGTSLIGDFINNGNVTSLNEASILLNGGIDGSFTNAGQIGLGTGVRSGLQGIIIGEQITGNFLNVGDIFSTQSGIQLSGAGVGVQGNFENNGAIDSSDNTAILINGAVGGSFSNTGALLASTATGRGISIATTVGNGFSNSGHIGSGTDRVGQQGIFVGGQISSNFLNEGDIFSAQSGIQLNQGGISVTGNFTNTGRIDSSLNTAILVNGGVGGSFMNSGELIAPTSRGISIIGTVGNGFTNSGQIGTSLAAGERAGQQGIFVGGQITGNFLNEADIFSTQNGILLNQAGLSLSGNFTNTGNVTSLNEAAILLNGGAGGSFTNSGQIGVGAGPGERAGLQGIFVGGLIAGNLTNEGNIFSTQSGIELGNAGTSLVGNFLNTATIDSLNGNAISVNGGVVGSFTNEGALLASSGSGRGISIGLTVGGGFTNSGQIGVGTASSDRVGLQGIFIGGQVTGNFLNEGNIFSNQSGIQLNDAGTSVTGSFTNTGNIDASGNTAILINGNIGSSFTNTGNLLAPINHGISISGMVGSGFTNSGQIGTDSDFIGQSGIRIGGLISGGFQNDGDIFSSQDGILLTQGGATVAGAFTNTGDINSANSNAITINGTVTGLFTNSGALTASDRGVSIGNAVNGGFMNSGQIGASDDRVGQQGIFVGGQVSGNFLNEGDIFSQQAGIQLNDGGTSLSGSFTNTGTIDSSGNNAILVNGNIGSFFTNTGSLLASSGRGISIGNSVSGNFTNSGQIGASDDRVGQQGIFVGGIVTGNLLNEGDIYSSQSGIHLNGGGVSLAGSFTNSGMIDSSGGDAIFLNADLGNSFNNTGALFASSGRGISILGIVGNGFTNSGQIGNYDARVGQQGIFAGSTVTGNFLNEGRIYSTQSGIQLNGGGTSLSGNFTNSAWIDSSSGDGISVNGNIGGSFTNSSNSIILTNGRGISIVGTVGDGFTNSGQISASTAEGIFVGGMVVGDFHNSGFIGSAQSSILLNENGTSLVGNFTNTGSVFSGFNTAIHVNGGINGSFTNSGQIGSGGVFYNGIGGIFVNGMITGDFLNDTGGEIFSTLHGIHLADAGLSLIGNFTNNESIDSVNGSAIVINGAINGSFTNTGALLASNQRGISIGGAVNSGFMNSGQIGADGDRVGQEGIFIGGLVTGNFLNHGDIFSTQSGIQLNAPGISLTGNFTNSGNVDSSSSNAINILGNIDGSFSNSGTIVAPSALSRGISIDGMIGNGFTNTGIIGAGTGPGERIGDQGIFVSGLITGDFLNSSTGMINSEGIGILLTGGLNGTFTNNGTIDSLNDDGLEIFLPTPATIINNFGGTITGGGGRSIEVVGGGSMFTNAGTLNGDVMLGVDNTGDPVVPGVINTVTLTDTGTIDGKLDIGVNTATSVTLNGVGEGLLSTAVTDGIFSGVAANQINGSLIKNGTGRWTLDQDLTVNTGVNVLDGNLRIGNGSTLTSPGGTTVNGGILSSESPTAGIIGPVILNTGILTAGGTFEITGDLTWNGGNIRSILGTSTGVIDIDGSLALPAPPGDFDLLNDATFLSNTDYLLLATTNPLGGFDPTTDFTGNKLFGLTPVFKIVGDELFVTFNGKLVATGKILQNSAPVSIPFAAEFIVDGEVTTGSTSESNIIRALTFNPGSSLQVFNTLEVTDGTFRTDSGSATINGGLIFTPDNFNKLGGGNLTVNSSGNVQGMTLINEGGLFLNGSFASAGGFLVNPNGLLGGTGLLTGDVVNDGTVAPGNSIGTLTVDGNYTQTSNGTLNMEIRSPTVRDRLIVSGSALLGGTLALDVQGGGLAFGDVVGLINANGGISGGFGRISGEPSGFRARPLLTGGNTQYNLIFAPRSYTQVAQGANQTALAAALDQWIGITSPEIRNATLQLDLLRGDEYPQVFEAILPSAYRIILPAAFSEAFNDGRTVSSQVMVYRSVLQPVEDNNETDVPSRRIWVDGRGAYSSSDPGSIDSESGTFLAGGDFRTSDTLNLGFYVGVQNRDSSKDSPEFDSDGFRLGAYAYQKLADHGYLVTVIGGGSTESSLEGTTAFGGSTDSNIDSSDWFARIEGGYTVHTDGFQITPFVGSQYTKVNIDGVTEKSDSVFALQLGDGSGDRVEGFVGLEISRPWISNEKIEVTPYGRLTLRHMLQEDNPSITATLNRGTGPSFTYVSPIPNSDGIEYGLGVRVTGKESSLGLVLGYTGFSADDYETHQGNVGVSVDL